ncbi:phage tail protein [Enterobacteriaceae bacterium 89]|nr:phage tail protein [Enterobacteriaceae bacterium 89]
MMLALGLFVFERRTLPYQSLKRDASYSWVPNKRMGKRSAYQFLGPGEEKITLDGALFTEITGGRVTLALIRFMAEQGCAWPLLDGNGTIYGMYVVSSVVETDSEFFPDGTPRKISFTLTLTRVDESLVAMAGNLRELPGALLDKATGIIGQLGG